MKFGKDLTGLRFGRLVVVRKVETINQGKRGSRSQWLCHCDCGNTKTVIRNSLTSGNTKSCGCLEKETKKTMHIKHGMAHERLYRIWCGMRDRCNRKSNKNFCYYGGRGITVCEEWQEFISFRDWALEYLEQ